MKKSGKIPSPTIAIDNKKIPLPCAVKKPEWSFSFKYFKQKRFFGLDSIDRNWTAALIGRLNDLNNIDIESLNINKKLKLDLRYHILNWNATNMPIKRSEFDWIEKEIIDNEEEFPFLQFHISRALGRIVGFWNTDSTIFYIILLDPLHNIQPCKKYNYKVDDCHPLSCNYTSLLKNIEDLKIKITKDPTIDVISELNNLPSNIINTNAIIFFLENDYLKDLEEKLKTHSLSDIIELGILNN